MAAFFCLFIFNNKGKKYMKVTIKNLLITILCLFLCGCGNTVHYDDEPVIFKTMEYPMKGDVNKDGRVTIADVTSLIDYLLVGGDDLSYDVNLDGKVSVNDVTELIDILLAGGNQEDDGNFIVNGVYFRMIKVDGGTFMMGAKNTEPLSFTFEKPQHEVTLSTFSIGETEVTQELYKAVMGVNPSINKENKKPVECVDWNDCKAFVDRLSEITGKNFRLPTEAEWEYAAIGGKYTHYYLFSGSDRALDVAWFITNSDGSSHTVKQLQPNELGLYDMSGNVYEWVNDWYRRYTEVPQTDPQGPDEGAYKVYRGGAWNVGAGDARCHFRYMRETTYKTQYHGFRIAL